MKVGLINPVQVHHTGNEKCVKRTVVCPLSACTANISRSLIRYSLLVDLSGYCSVMMRSHEHDTKEFSRFTDN